jgi:serine/threonine-protein kinase
MGGDCILIVRMFAAGDTLGPYTISRRLGAGAMGEVYQARHRHMGRDAAIKVLRSELTEDAEVVNRFFTEARATAAVRHPGIVEIFDCDLHRSGRAFIVMEYLDGEDLANRLQSAGSFAKDWPALRGIARQLAGALGAAHAAGIVHRDLKPGNIFLVGKGAAPTVKIVDFGIAKLMSRGAGEHSLTQTGHILGTPLYMSPEQAKGAKTIDHRTDIYALGCVLFEMITGKPPFVRKGPADVLVAHLHEPPPRASSLEPTVPPALDELVAAMLAKSPDGRPQSMADVAAKLAEPAPAPSAAPMAPTMVALGGTTVGRPAAKDAPAQSVRGAAPAVASTRAGFVGREAQIVNRAGDTTLGKSAGEIGAVGDDEVAPPRPRRTGAIIAAAAVVLVAGAAALFTRSRADVTAPAAAAPPAATAPVALPPAQPEPAPVPAPAPVAAPAPAPERAPAKVEPPAPSAAPARTSRHHRRAKASEPEFRAIED